MTWQYNALRAPTPPLNGRWWTGCTGTRSERTRVIGIVITVVITSQNCITGRKYIGVYGKSEEKYKELARGDADLGSENKSKASAAQGSHVRH